MGVPMSVKTSISLTEQQDAFARALVTDGRFSSVSAVLQHGLDLLRRETELHDAEVAAMRDLLGERRAGRFVPDTQGRERTVAMISAKRAEHGLDG